MEFYSAMAQLFPVLLLAIVWESRFLDRLKSELRPSRKTHGSGGWFWTKPKVRIYSWFVTGIIVATIGLTALALGGVIPDCREVKITILASLTLTLGTMITRLWVDIFDATKKLQGE